MKRAATNDEVVVHGEAETQKMSRLGKMFIGAHISVAGGLYNAFANTKKIGGNSMALFLKSQRKWDSKPLSDSDVAAFDMHCSQCKFDKNMILPHGSYLINLGNPDSEKRKKSYGNFVDDLKRCQSLGIKLYNFHPGSTVGECSREESIAHVANAINDAHKDTQGVTVVLETMAGQGNVIGSRFEDLRAIIDMVHDKSRIGVCIDTCHVFSAGYDIRCRESYDKTMDEFARIVGFEFLRGVHLNDSMADLGSCKDRHENIGKGKIGIDAFRFLVNDARFRGIPMVLETPVGKGLDSDDVYRQEIELLRGLIEKGVHNNHPGTVVRASVGRCPE